MLSDRCPVLCVCDVSVLWPNGWADQDETWQCHACAMPCASAPVTLCYIGIQLHSQKGAQQPHIRKLQITGAGFACVRIIRGPCLLWPNSWMDQDQTWHGSRPRPSPNCVKWGTSSPPPKGHASAKFSAMSVVAKRLDESRCSLVRR